MMHHLRKGLSLEAVEDLAELRIEQNRTVRLLVIRQCLLGNRDRVTVFLGKWFQDAYSGLQVHRM